MKKYYGVYDGEWLVEATDNYDEAWDIAWCYCMDDYAETVTIKSIPEETYKKYLQEVLDTES